MHLTNCFQERLSELMTDRNMNTISLGRAIGVSNETVRRWKNGQRSILLPQMIKLADFFCCSLDYLTGRSDVLLGYIVQPLPLFFDRLKEVMEEKSVSRYRLVKALPIYDSYFTNWKNGKSPNMLTLVMLADYLDTSIDYLVGREP